MPECVPAAGGAGVPLKSRAVLRGLGVFPSLQRSAFGVPEIPVECMCFPNSGTAARAGSVSINNYASGGETGEEEEEEGEVDSAGKRRDEFPLLKPVPTRAASAGPGIPRSGEERMGGALGNVRDDGRRKSRWRFWSSCFYGIRLGFLELHLCIILKED